MKKQDKNIKASIEVKHLDPAFYIRGAERVLDPVIKGLRTEVTVTCSGPVVYLKSEMQVTRLEKRKTIRIVWWNSKHDASLNSTELLQVKIKADQWYQDNKKKSDYRMIYLSDILNEYLQDPQVSSGTNEIRKNRLMPITERLKKIEVNDVTSDLLLELQDCLLGYERWNDSTKISSLIYLSHFISFVFKKTKNKKVAVALTEFNLLKEKLKKNYTHHKTLESITNTDLRERLIKTFQKMFMAKTKYKQGFCVLFLLPMRISEVISIAPENITKNNIFIEKTKTIKEGQGGFNVPSTEKVNNFVKEHSLFTTRRQKLSDAFTRVVGFTVHGIRSIFSDYMTREGFQWNLIESCLSHKTSSAVAECYHRDQKNYFYEQRKPLMYHWYDFIFGCMEEAERRNQQERN